MIILIGFFLPALIGVVTRYVSDSTARFWVSAFICAIVGVAVNFIEANGFSGYNGLTMLEVADSLSKSVMAMIGMVKLSYEVIWNNQNLSDDRESPLEKLNLK